MHFSMTIWFIFAQFSFLLGKIAFYAIPTAFRQEYSLLQPHFRVELRVAIGIAQNEAQRISDKNFGFEDRE